MKEILVKKEFAKLFETKYERQIVELLDIFNILPGKALITYLEKLDCPNPSKCIRGLVYNSVIEETNGQYTLYGNKYISDIVSLGAFLVYLKLGGSEELTIRKAKHPFVYVMDIKDKVFRIISGNLEQENKLTFYNSMNEEVATGTTDILLMVNKNLINVSNSLVKDDMLIALVDSYSHEVTISRKDGEKFL